MRRRRNTTGAHQHEVGDQAPAAAAGNGDLRQRQHGGIHGNAARRVHAAAHFNASAALTPWRACCAARPRARSPAS
jgi:hypothetical protein